MRVLKRAKRITLGEHIIRKKGMKWSSFGIYVQVEINMGITGGRF